MQQCALSKYYLTVSLALFFSCGWLWTCISLYVVVVRTLRMSWSYRLVWSRKSRSQCGCWRKTAMTNKNLSHHFANNLKMWRTSTLRCTADFRSALPSPLSLPLGWTAEAVQH